MANIDGDNIKRTTLTANQEKIIEFTKHVQSISILASGGTVYFKFNKTMAGIDDLSANSIVDGESFDTYKASQINSLHLFSATAATVQWDIP